MNAINGQQIKKIYAIGQALGIVEQSHDDDLHILIGAVTGKGSVKELTYREAADVIAELQRRQGTPPPRKKPKQHEEVAGGVTEGMQRKIWALMYDLQSLDVTPSTASLGERLCGIIKKELNIEARPRRPFAWLQFEDGNRLVEILKGYVRNAQKKAGGSG